MTKSGLLCLVVNRFIDLCIFLCRLVLCVSKLAK